ncbi:glycosyltransferase family 4 protein [Campylobacter sp. CLAX-7218-21]|uniref:glycosyltransferase family 4 protein n=1 Tax=Campylobacter devanensis TaxID=3161138 RepID=UPI002E9FA5F2|nr:glycosyltransferase family 4 protein [Campylobacter sp. CLAX-7218-21]
MKNKILMIYDDISYGGGAERVICNFSNSLIASGYEVMVFSIALSKQCPYEYHQEVVIRFIKENAKPKGLAKVLHEIKRLIMPIKKWNAIKKRAVFKQAINEFNPDFIICHTHFDNSLTKILKKMQDKIIKVVHNSFDAYEKWQIDLNIYKNIVLLSNHDINKFKTKYPNSNFYIIPNFIPNISNLNTNYSQKVVLSMGRMANTDQKGFLRLIDIWKLIQDSGEFNDWKLHIVGDGDLKEQIKTKIENLNLSNSIILKPFTKDVESEYLSASIYAMASHFEGLPMVLIEAGTYALPTIAFDIATGPSDIIEDEKSGYLIEDNNLNEYANKLKTIMQDENLRAKMGAKSKEIVKSKFSKEVVMKQWMELFERIKNNA